MSPLDDEIRYKLLKLLHEQPDLSQRELAEVLGVSVGKTNYCIKALIDKGLVKARNFKNSRNKKAYVYFLTPVGIDEKAQVTMSFLKRKMQEYDDLSKEIETLRDEVSKLREQE